MGFLYKTEPTKLMLILVPQKPSLHN